MAGLSISKTNSIKMKKLGRCTFFSSLPGLDEDGAYICAIYFKGVDSETGIYKNYLETFLTVTELKVHFYSHVFNNIQQKLLNSYWLTTAEAVYLNLTRTQIGLTSVQICRKILTLIG